MLLLLLLLMFVSPVYSSPAAPAPDAAVAPAARPAPQLAAAVELPLLVPTTAESCARVCDLDQWRAPNHTRGDCMAVCVDRLQELAYMACVDGLTREEIEASAMMNMGPVGLCWTHSRSILHANPRWK